MCRGLQPTSLICHVETFQISMPAEENPPEVNDLPVPPPANPACALRTRVSETVESKSEDRYRRNLIVFEHSTH